MKPIRASAVLTVLVGAGAVALWWRANRQPPTSDETPVAAADEVPARGADASLGAARQAQTAAAATDLRRPAPSGDPALAASAGTAAAELAAAQSMHAAAVAWPMAPSTPVVRAGASTKSEPAVPEKLAFRALWYLGADPDAEKTWSRAINDPNHPPGVRSDLIVDMVDEGYTDNSNPGKEDLPLILARLEILERYSPYAMDEVNARAFEDAYRTLLAMYIRLGGQARAKR